MLIISPPFGNYINSAGALSVVGSYTLYPRPGILKQVLKTVRHANGGWVNQISLRNKGIVNAPKDLTDKILSLCEETDERWRDLFEYVSSHYDKEALIELNLSCPNTSYSINVYDVCKLFKDYFSTVIVKLPPIDYWCIYTQARKANVTCFHCCNSYNTPIGGISGKPLQVYSLAAIKQLKPLDKNITIIGGGGVSTIDDIRLFKQAGADHISISSALFNPKTHWNLKKLILETHGFVKHRNG